MSPQPFWSVIFILPLGEIGGVQVSEFISFISRISPCRTQTQESPNPDSTRDVHVYDRPPLTGPPAKSTSRSESWTGLRPRRRLSGVNVAGRSEEPTSELQSRQYI